MYRKLAPSALALALVALTAACGGGDQPEPAAEAPAETPAGGATVPAEVPPGQATAPAVSTANLPPGVTAQMVSEGQGIFAGQGICYTCHGQQGQGTALAPNLTDQQWINISSGEYEEIVTVVTNGVAQPKEHPAPMPAKGGANLTDDQVRAVAAYVYSLSHGGAS
jgi:mono/diheme cytochrome c family protein